MRFVIQRVSEASVTIDHVIHSKIETGFLVLVGVEESDTNEDGETLIKQEPISADSSFLFVELKLISIDYKCIDYSQLMQKFLCINSNASVEHIKKYIAKNMNILDDLFEVCI